MARVESLPPPAWVAATTSDDVERMYRDYRRLLLYIAGHKFGVPNADTEALLQETMIAFLTTHTRIDNPKAWLVATMCNVSRRYWRYRIRMNDIEGGVLTDATDVALDMGIDRIERELIVQRVLSLLHDRDRELLRLRYFEQLTARAIGELRGTSLGYTEKRIRIALSRAREIYRRLHAAGDPAQTRVAEKRR